MTEKTPISRLDEVKLMLMTNESLIFSAQHTASHLELMELIEHRCRLEIEKHELERKFQL